MKHESHISCYYWSNVDYIFNSTHYVELERANNFRQWLVNRLFYSAYGPSLDNIEFIKRIIQ